MRRTTEQPAVPPADVTPPKEPSRAPVGVSLRVDFATGRILGPVEPPAPPVDEPRSA